MNARLKKLAFRASHRGMKELDLVIGGFAKAHLESLTEHEVDEFERILELQDPDLFTWLIDREEVPKEHNSEIMVRLKAFSLTPADYKHLS